MNVIFSMVLFLSAPAHALEDNVWPFSKFYGTYSIKSCSGMTEFVNCNYKFLNIEKGKYLNNGKPVPSVDFLYFDVKDKAPFRSNNFLIGDNTKYKEDGAEASYERKGYPDSGSGSVKNVNINISLSENKSVQFEMKVEDVPKDGEGRLSTAKLVLEKVK